MTPDYIPKIPFWTPQQAECFARSRDQRIAAIFMEPRCGKSKPIVDTACYHYERPESPLHVTGLLIVAWPQGVHRGWITDACAENIPDRIPWKGFIWRSAKDNQVGYKTEFNELCEFKGLAVLAINAEALPSEITRKAIGKFLKARRTMLVADESSFMMTPGARRTRIMLNAGLKPNVIMKRILDGTPASEGPFDLYGQIGFLDKGVFGFNTFTEFKNHFAEWEIRVNHAQGMSYPAVKEDKDGHKIYRNLDELQAKLAPISYRATFAECFNTPRKVYQKRYFDLTVEQRRVYNDLRDEYRAELKTGEGITATHVLTRMLRLQQVSSNYFPAQDTVALHEACNGEGCEGCKDLGVIETRRPAKVIDPENNPRLEALKEELRPGNAMIVWARFRQDVTDCMVLADGMGLKPVRYDGEVDDEAKAAAKDDFQAGRAGVIVGNQQSLGRGIPLWRAYGHVFYSNSFSLRQRIQAEDRAEIKHRTVGTSVVDLVAEDTLDDLVIIPALRDKLDVAALIQRDPRRQWI